MCRTVRVGGPHSKRCRDLPLAHHAGWQVTGCKPAGTVQWVVSSWAADMDRPTMAHQASRAYPGRYASMESPGRARNVAANSPIGALDCSRLWAGQGAKAQIPGSARSVWQRAFGRPRRIPGGALHIRDQFHLVPGKLGEGQADHYIFPPVPCPMILAGGDLDYSNSRWQNRQPAMLARTRPGPAGARRTPGRALGRCGTIDAKPPGAPPGITLSAPCIFSHFS